MAPAYIEKDVVVNPGATTRVEVRVKAMGAIVGTVENTSTDALLKGVKIQLMNGDGVHIEDTTTGDDGAYRFGGLESGTYAVRMVLPKGYLSEGESELTFELTGGGEHRADFRVYRHGAIEGRVLTEAGEAMADVEVELVDSTGTVVRAVHTDGEGIYSFLDVPVDKYKVRVAVPDDFNP